MPDSESSPRRVPLVPEPPLAAPAGPPTVGGEGAPSCAPSSAPSPVPVLDPAAIASLAEDLAQARWSVERMDQIFSTRARDALMRDQRVPALVELRELAEPAAQAGAHHADAHLPEPGRGFGDLSHLQVRGLAGLPRSAHVGSPRIDVPSWGVGVPARIGGDIVSRPDLC
jgi:hypothetical protein